jgi:hypothetical protein
MWAHESLEIWPHRVEIPEKIDRKVADRWLADQCQPDSWFWATWHVVYFSHQEDAVRFSLIWT